VRFGVILLQYRGAQGAPSTSRSKEDALALARSIAEAAHVDFRAQVSKGDPGSMEDAGRMPRGVLEPATEFALFTLAAGGVSDPVDTPRGFWIVKRLE
jgi:parvulin-like peptidyl-prolyl isomerase